MSDNKIGRCLGCGSWLWLPHFEDKKCPTCKGIKLEEVPNVITR